MLVSAAIALHGWLARPTSPGVTPATSPVASPAPIAVTRTAPTPLPSVTPGRQASVPVLVPAPVPAPVPDPPSAREAGYAAFRAGQPSSANPYDGWDRDRATAWMGGWNDAKYDKR